MIHYSCSYLVESLDRGTYVRAIQTQYRVDISKAYTESLVMLLALLFSTPYICPVDLYTISSLGVVDADAPDGDQLAAAPGHE